MDYDRDGCPEGYIAMATATTVQGCFEACPHSAVGLLRCTLAVAPVHGSSSLQRGDAVDLCVVCGSWRALTSDDGAEDEWNAPALWTSVFAKGSTGHRPSVQAFLDEPEEPEEKGGP